MRAVEREQSNKQDEPNKKGRSGLNFFHRHNDRIRIVEDLTANIFHCYSFTTSSGTLRGFGRVCAHHKIEMSRLDNAIHVDID